jgi:hypothetical protein
MRAHRPAGGPGGRVCRRRRERFEANRQGLLANTHEQRGTNYLNHRQSCQHERHRERIRREHVGGQCTMDASPWARTSRVSGVPLSTRLVTGVRPIGHLRMSVGDSSPPGSAAIGPGMMALQPPPSSCPQRPPSRSAGHLHCGWHQTAPGVRARGGTPTGRPSLRRALCRSHRESIKSEGRTR